MKGGFILSGFLKGLLGNTWFVGISGGLISSLMMFFITEKIISNRNKKEYIRNINRANNEVVNLLKPYISYGELPNFVILRSIVRSVAYEYSVELNQMYSLYTYCEILIKEIVSNTYISIDEKKEYTNRLEVYMLEYDSMIIESKKKNLEFETKFINNKPFSSSMMNVLYDVVIGDNSISYILSIVVFFLILISSLYKEDTFNRIINNNSISESNTIYYILFIAMILTLILALINLYDYRSKRLLSRINKHLSNDDSNNNDDDDSSNDDSNNNDDDNSNDE